GKFDSKEAYSENEIKQMVKNDTFWEFNFTFNTPLMQDYKNEKGEFKREGIMLMYALTYDTFAKAESPYTKLSEYGKFLHKMPSSYSPSAANDTNKKPKTPEELKKEMLDKLGEVYLKILENTKETDNADALKEINGFINEIIRENSSKSKLYSPNELKITIKEIPYIIIKYCLIFKRFIPKYFANVLYNFQCTDQPEDFLSHHYI
ncbi:MAG: hypothetical protein K2I63_00085, partial [Helicobacter sp.]|nr:hypothetical protein [Helicobacter sp.]